MTNSRWLAWVFLDRGLEWRWPVYQAFVAWKKFVLILCLTVFWSIVWSLEIDVPRRMSCADQRLMFRIQRGISSQKTQASLTSFSAVKELSLIFTFWLTFFLREHMGAFSPLHIRIEMTSLADRLNIGCEGMNKGEDNTRLWGWATGKMELQFIEMGKAVGGAG